MKYLYFLLILIFSQASAVVAYADNTKNELKGEAIITVENKIYTLPLRKCYNASNNVDGKKNEVFVMATHLSRRSKVTGPRFTALGSLTGKTGFKLNFKGGPSNGGILYQAKMPFDSFKENKLVFKGKADSIKRENKKPIRKIVAIEINIKCF